MISRIWQALDFADNAFLLDDSDDALARFGSMVEPLRAATAADPHGVGVVLRQALQGDGEALNRLLGALLA